MLSRVSALRERIDRERKAKSLTWSALAQAAGVARQTLDKAFRREDAGEHHNMDSRTVLGLARALGRTAEWVSVGEGADPSVIVVDLRAAIFAVVDAVSEDMRIPKAQARAIVGQYAFDEERPWKNELDLYRLVMRETQSMRPPSSHPSLPPAAGTGVVVGRKLPKKR
jgi:transcriptional regulator with XRE-family HTH domain